jgi:oligoendopeptidase F
MTIQGPKWNINSEYSSVDSVEFASDLNEVSNLIEQLKMLGPKVSKLIPTAESPQAQSAHTDAGIDLISRCFVISSRAEVLMGNLETYLHCILSVDSADAKARSARGTIENLQAAVADLWTPVEQFLLLCSDEFLALLIARPEGKAREFLLRAGRWFRPHLLSVAEESLIARLNVNGPTAWGNLYDSIAGSLKCSMVLADQSPDPQVMGITRAGGFLDSPNPHYRETAYRAINAAWESQTEPCAAILNALAGWRVDLCARRSFSVPLAFLDSPLHTSRILPATLAVMMDCVEKAGEAARKGLRLQAHALGKKQLGPWDLSAPAPVLSGAPAPALEYADGIERIAHAFGAVGPAMGDFVRLMAANGWIEGSVGERKRPGAYCTLFPKSRSPRVYMTYQGTRQGLRILAHELGHAFHSWVMGDLPLEQTHYPMTLAETASILAEAALSDSFVAQASSPADRLSVAWQQASDAASFLLNIPMRFRFEQEFYQLRSTKMFSPTEFSELMEESWRHFYRDTLSEMNPLFWCSKLHFHISSLSFYNFPYTFGYLFSLGVYARRKTMGEDFYPAYVALLRDTGVMTAEDVARKHLGVDLTQPEFWNGAIEIVTGHIKGFEKVIGECGFASPQNLD